MSDQLAAVSVLNGEVQVGDRVAYATREGNIAAMHIGIVVGFGSRKVAYEDSYEPTVKVRVERESGYGQQRVNVLEKSPRTVGFLNRMVKL